MYFCLIKDMIIVHFCSGIAVQDLFVTFQTDLILYRVVFMYCVCIDPAAEEFHYPVTLDIRELITVEDVMEELNLGPNGYVIYLNRHVCFFINICLIASESP